MKKQKWSKDGKLLGYTGKATEGQKHHDKITHFAIHYENRYLSNGQTKIKCKTWLNRYRKKCADEMSGMEEISMNEKNWVMKQAKQIESVEPQMIEWTSEWKVVITSHLIEGKTNVSVFEQLGNAQGVSTKELFSGKYGNSVDEIMASMSKL